MSRFEMETDIPTREDLFYAKLKNNFIGRNSELKQLHDYLRQVENQSGKFVVITGEAGIGKTSLVHQFSKEAKNSGAIAIEESFDGVNKYNPYAPFFRIVERLMPLCKKQELNFSSDIKTGFDPGNGNGNGNGKHLKNWDIQSLYSLQTQFGLIQQKIVSSLLKAAKENVIILILSDIHLASKTMWQFIHYLSKSLVEHKILILVTLRQDGRELNKENIPDYVEVLKRMSQRRLVEKIQINRFTKKDIRLFLKEICKLSDFSNQFIPFLYSISGGLPSILVRSLEVMYAEDIIFEQNGVWFNRENLSKEKLADVIYENHDMEPIALKLSRLTNQQMEMIQYASLINEPFGGKLLSELLDISLIDTTKELFKLKNNKILFDVGLNQFQFKQAIFAVKIKEQIPKDKLSNMHFRIAEIIENSETIPENEKVYSLACHYSKSNKPTTAFAYLRKAFDLALSSFAFTEAKDFFDGALKLYEDNCKNYNCSDLIYLFLKMVWVDRILGHYDDSIKHAQRSLELCKNNCDQEIKNQILVQQGLTYFRMNNWEEAKNCFLTCLKNKESQNHFVIAMANFGLGNICLELAEYKKATNFYNKSLNIAKKLKAKSLIGTVYNNLGIIENIQNNRLQSVGFYSQSIPIFEKLGDDFGLAKIYHNIGMTYAQENSWQKANEFYGKSLRVSDNMGLLPLKSMTFLSRALCLINLKKLNEAREYNFKAHRLLKKLNDQLGFAEYYKIQGILEREQKNWQEAKYNFDLASKMFKKCQNKLGAAETKYERAVLALAINDHEDAQLWFRKAKVAFQNLELLEKTKVVDKYLSDLSIRD